VTSTTQFLIERRERQIPPLGKLKIAGITDRQPIDDPTSF